MDNKSNLFFSLYSSVHGRLLAYITMMVHNPAVAEDLLQETSVIMWEKFDAFEEGTNFAAWAVAIARNKTLEYLRENRKTKKLFRCEFYEAVSHVAEEATADYSQRIKLLEHCFEKLKPGDRQLITLRYKNNIPIKEISLQIGKPISTLYLHLSKVLGLLRMCISQSLAKQEV